MTTRSKFKCTAVETDDRFPDGNNVKLEAVTSGSEENKSFWKYTPSGSIQMFITNKKAVELFVAGKEYYVDFSKAGGDEEGFV